MKKIMMLAMIMVVALPVLAQEGGDPPPIVEAAHNQVARFLQLSDDQVEQWDLIYRIHRDAEQPLQEGLRAVQEEIDALFESGPPNSADLGELVIERHALSEALREVHVVYYEDVLTLLDESQARRLRFIARADEVQQIIPAFKLFELIPRR
jgi:Spy/CpxP family protein refolding chaperone